MTLDAKLWTPTLNKVVLTIGNAESNRLVSETVTDGGEAVACSVSNRLRQLAAGYGGDHSRPKDPTQPSNESRNSANTSGQSAVPNVTH